MDVEHEKKLVAQESVKLVKNDMLVGLGSGSTATYMIKELGKKVANGLTIKGVPSSDQTAKLAKEVGIPLIALEEAGTLDINIDGADEFDPKMQLIKGGGGALLREKIVAHNSKYNVIIADSKKKVTRLGKFKLPIETIPFATKNILSEIKKLGLPLELRMKDSKPYTTDEKNYIIDVDIFKYNSMTELNTILINIPGVVETGLFLTTTDLIIFSNGKSIEKIERPIA